MSTGVGSHDSGPAPSVVSDSGGIAAPYGRACTNCSRAKCKCILRPVGGPCERCHRLSKLCQPSNPVRRRSRKPRSSRTAQLEEKLDGLVTMLRQSGRSDLSNGFGPGPVTARPTAAIPPSATAARTPSSELGDARSGFGSVASADDARTRQTPFLTPTTHTDNSPEGTGTGYEFGDGLDLPSPAEAETMFEGFRDRNMKAFPFMCFGEATTQRALRAERPFLWLCVMTVASRVTSQQLALGQRVRQVVSQKVIFENERSMDYLLGILVILGWANHQLGTKPFKCMFSQVAIGLVFDLELARDPLDALNPFICFKAAQERADRDETSVAQTFFVKSQTPRTMEQRRAVVACYLVTASVAGFLGKMVPLRWTPYMDECLEMLDDKPESPLDRSLVAIVKMQLLKGESSKLSSRFDKLSREGANSSKPAASMYVKMLQAQLQRIIQDLPADLRSTDAIISQLHCTELSIQEVAIASHKGALSPTNLPDVARLDILYACLHAIKAWFDHFFTLHPTSYFYMGFITFEQLSHCVVALYHLSVLEDPVWDRASVRTTIDLIATLDEIGNRFLLVRDGAGLCDDTGEGTSFDRAIKTIRGLKNTWEAALAPFPKTDSLTSTATAGAGVDGGPAGLGAGGMTEAGVGEADLVQFGFDMMDNRLFNDIFIPFDF
ncbi:hypothetical protein CGRA01v4_12414 [Colletotrichum graminicola]|uniref:Zn(2)-C6 fungal-type domain-containing protein n=1 Tax=Colletotrichum graminicola (strain M1.001 / M2 / FGSC 10212) TaxID=645133 RepID=E3QSU7_COLGM|nr:uncharacterized protein GLRG_09079 [Colletotrichum graminicola M1.001]EFQ33935.1 hypothetical protein GLRG_09079 [Colletotrichum graminicola M1.001]WDK21125.1 hypothetical protein CGRA01v4_12414 [Colletotrichum graminicola]